MARSFHRKRSLEPNSELNVTALIDLGFALLIIFMISTPLIENEQFMELDLPVSSQSKAASEPDRVNILVLDTYFMLDGNALDNAQLEAELQRISEEGSSPVFNVRANAVTPYQNVVTVIDMLKRYKLSKISLVTKLEE